ncbi:MAG TPA: lysylphosphatidylglycerol synthase domain-containing protein [Fibrobacteria bacterium]|nr:lysylphosphatidylglycerol synthase domain-containing protein [Fibrobacteria bacterium]
MLNPKLLAWLRAGLTLLTFAAIAWYVRSRPRPDLSALSLRWELLAWACACLPPLLYLRVRKWRLLLRGAAPDVTLAQAMRSYLGAMALGLVTPGRVGEFSRGLYLPQRAVQGWRGAGLVLIDNWIDFLAVLTWACLGWLACFGWTGLACGAALAAAFAPIPFWLRAAGKVTPLLPSRWGFRASARAGLEAGEGVPRRDYLGAYGAAMLAYGFEWLQIAFLLGFLVPAVPDPWRLAGMMALVSLANSFQVTLAGLGVREGVSMLLLAREGVGAEAAVLAAFLQSALILFVPALAGLAVKPIALYAEPRDAAPRGGS